MIPIQPGIGGDPRAVKLRVSPRKNPFVQKQPILGDQIQFGRSHKPDPHAKKHFFSLSKLAFIPAAVAMMLSTMPSQTGNTNLQTQHVANNGMAAPTKTGFVRSLSFTDTQRLQEMKRSWDSVEAMDLSDSGRQNAVDALEVQWRSLLQDARNDNAGAREVARLLVLEQNEKELTEPGLNLVRFNYDKFNTLQSQLRNSEISQEKFNTEVQWRAILGIYTHVGTNINKGIPVDSERFYEPISRLMRDNENTEIQKWGSYFLLSGFGSLTPAHQNAVIDRFAHEFLNEPDGIKKQDAMWGLTRLRPWAPSSPVWNRVLTDVRERVQDEKRPETERRYDIMTLGLLRDSQLPALAESVLKESSGTEFQQSIAWSLGRMTSSPKALDILRGMATNTKTPSLAREMAVYSLGELNDTFGSSVQTTLRTLAASTEGDRYVRAAAQAIQAKLNDRSQTESDFYINLLLRTTSEKDNYKQLRSQYVVGFDQLNTAQKNFVDKALLPYRHLLPRIINQGGRHWIVNGNITDTPSYSNLIGVRIQDGRLWDNVGGVSSTQGAVTSIFRVSPGGANVFSHEFTHHIHQMVLNQSSTDSQKVVDLYRQAMNEKRVLDYYAATNEYEYLAQGGEAYNSKFKNHAYLADLIFNRGYEDAGSHVAAQLMRQDPAMYEFIDSLADHTRELILGFNPERPTRILVNFHTDRMPTRNLEPERAQDYSVRK